MIVDLIRLSRPKHWVKNVFVLLPVPFALADGAQLDPLVFAMGLFSFCVAASAVYAINDAQDVERDRLHETKKHRPIAAGRISLPVAYGWGIALILAGASLAYATGSVMAMVLFGLYITSNLFYTFVGKHITLLDVFLLSAMYLMRVLLGCALLDVTASNWLLLCSGSLALFLALAKRRADVVSGQDSSTRPALEGYNQGFLDQAMGISATMTVMAYAMYTVDAANQGGLLVIGREFAALPFVVFGVLDYLRMAHVKQGAGASPVDMLLRSPALIATGVGWLAATTWSLRLGG